jgi:hypothetical protein
MPQDKTNKKGTKRGAPKKSGFLKRAESSPGVRARKAQIQRLKDKIDPSLSNKKLPNSINTAKIKAQIKREEAALRRDIVSAAKAGAQSRKNRKG